MFSDFFSAIRQQYALCNEDKSGARDRRTKVTANSDVSRGQGREVTTNRVNTSALIH
jgi:hypothetical protein